MAALARITGAKYASRRLAWKSTGLKTCARCKCERTIDLFPARSGGIPGSYCKACEALRTSKRNPRVTPVRIETESHRECRQCGVIKEKSSDFYRTKQGISGFSAYCKPCQRAATEKSRKRSKGAWDRARRLRIKSDPKLILKYRSIWLVRAALRSRASGCRNGSVTSDFWKRVGYSSDELFVHIEKQFVDGMSWGNMDKWQIDHITPVSHFSFTSLECEEFKRCWSLANLRPLWAVENAQKGSSILFLI